VGDDEPEIVVVEEEGPTQIEAAAPPVTFQARVLVIPTSRAGYLRVVVVPPGGEPPAGMLSATLVPSGEHADAIRALLFGID
jgi:hypothetical protein